MSEEHMVMAGRLLASVLAGGLIGLERSIRGRPAGLRTHTLVCLASTLLMLITVYEWQWMESHAPDSIRMDPTRMAQGIMTGIGFYFPAIVTTALVILVLSIFRWVESHMRTQSYARLDIAFRRGEALDEAALRTELAGHGLPLVTILERRSQRAVSRASAFDRASAIWRRSSGFVRM